MARYGAPLWVATVSIRRVASRPAGVGLQLDWCQGHRSRDVDREPGGLHLRIVDEALCGPSQNPADDVAADELTPAALRHRARHEQIAIAREERRRTEGLIVCHRATVARRRSEPCRSHWCICNNATMSASAVDQIVSDCLAVRVRLIGRTVTAVYDGALEGHGLTIAQLNLLAALGKAGPCPPSMLGEVLQLERSTVSRNLNLLLRHGWIEAVSSDAKGMREVALTREGRAKIESVMPQWRKAQGASRETPWLGGRDGGTGNRKQRGTPTRRLGEHSRTSANSDGYMLHIHQLRGKLT